MNFMISLTDPYAYAFHNTSQDYPLGKRSWYFVNESCLHNRFQIRRLKLTTCEAESQFTCDDGTCISIMGRCDQKRDCDDFSDEFDCKLVSLNQFHYIKDYPPQERGGRRTEVTYHVEILSLDDIRELGMSLNVQFRLNLSWLDPRIIYHNLKDDPVMNSLTQGEKEKIWIPKIIFNNTDDENESILDAKASLSVIKQGNYTLSSIKEEGTDEKYIFSGSENPLVYSRHHNIQFQCNFDMTYYPFDVQMCYMIFRRIPHGRFALNPSQVRSLTYLGERELLQYFIDDWNILTESASGFVIVIRMKRRYLYQLLTTYLPSLCLFFIIHATQYFKISYFHTRIMVSLTGMLVMTTLFLNTSSTLPKTSYFKMIDIWMVFGLLLPFLEVVLHTVTEYRRRDPRYRPPFEEIRAPSCTPIEINPGHAKCKNNARMMGRPGPGHLDFGSKYPSTTCCRDLQNGRHEWMGGGLNTDESLILPLPPPSPTSSHSNLDDKSAGDEAFGIIVQSSPPNTQIVRTCSLRSQERRRKRRDASGSRSSNIEMHGSRSSHQLDGDTTGCTRHVGPTIKVEDAMVEAEDRDQRCPLMRPISGDNLQVKSPDRHSPISDCKLSGQGQRLPSPSTQKALFPSTPTPSSSRVSGLETSPRLEESQSPEIPSNPQILFSQGQSFTCGPDLGYQHHPRHHPHRHHHSSVLSEANEGGDGKKQGQDQSTRLARGKETSAWLLKNNRYWKWIYSCCVRPELTNEQQTNKDQDQQQQQQQQRQKHQFVRQHSRRPGHHCCCCQRGSNPQVRTLNVEDCQYDENAQSGLLTPALPWDIPDESEKPLSRSPDLVTADLSRTIVPLLIFLFNVIYWTVAFLHN
ncbi:uncharacterized protein LOC131885543 [Tigriopus californicus]|uniref:uncharacterized protein LOC131885543 n=1 Tax=Tigriopus californicus TaxID=6832 RepID=UPI0027DAB481|nr:uncharacterized protein LOC131885543 [Tigriopus californicus]